MFEQEDRVDEDHTTAIQLDEVFELRIDWKDWNQKVNKIGNPE
jgi:hypothetical protein